MSQSDADNSSKLKKNDWFLPVITTLLGIIVAVGLTWYQLYRTEKENEKAELERIKSVKTNLVSIIEDHVINNHPIDIGRLSRLIDIQSRKEKIKSPPRLMELIQLAELNVITSGYLDFAAKEEYKKVFDSTYTSLREGYSIDYSDNKNSALIDDLVTSIKTGNPEESITKLQLLLEAYASDLGQLEAQAEKKSILEYLIDYIRENPILTLTFIIVYLGFLIYLPLLYRRIILHRFI